MENLAVVGDEFVGELLGEVKNTYCSIMPSTDAERALLFNAINNPDHKTGDCVNEIIVVKDVFCETVELVNKETGEVDVVPRVVMIDIKGKSFQSVSRGIFGAIKNLFQLYGSPTWESGIPVKVRQINKGDKRILTLEIVTK